MKEAQVQTAIRLALGRIPDAVFWRNNTGVATFGGASVRYGLSIGSSDLIGIVAGRFCALEVKGPKGRLTPHQERFLDLVRLKGGFAACVSSVGEAHAAVERCRKGECA